MFSFNPFSGRVIEVVNYGDTVRSAVDVKWPGGETGAYKLGHHGETEVQLEEDEAVEIGLVYMSQLPALCK